MSAEQSATVVPIFKTVPKELKAETKRLGRPVFKDMEMVEVHFAGNRETVGAFPANAFAGYVKDAFGNSQPMTYAEKYAAQYARFKANSQQIAEGTPLSELPFLTEGKRAEYRALGVHTAEALAALDGANLKSLGMGGRAHKTQAEAYLKRAQNSAEITKIADENVALRERLAEMERQMAEMSRAPAEAVDDGEAEDLDENPASEFDGWDDARLKDYIADATGGRPRGQPSHATLVRMATEAFTNPAQAAE